MPRICPKTGKLVKMDFLYRDEPECVKCEHQIDRACRYPKTVREHVLENLISVSKN